MLLLHENWLIVFVNRNELPFDIVVVGLIGIRELLEVHEDVFHLLEVLGLLPEVSLWVLDALGFDVLDFVHGVLFYLSPDQFFLKEIEDHEVETPKIISTREIDVVMRIQTGKTNCSTEVSLFSLSHWVLVAV